MSTVLDVLVRAVGRVITGVRRVYFEFGGELDRSRGALELTFDDGSVVVLDSGADGELMRADEVAWHDPFEGHLDEENRAFIAECGKWTAVDARDESRFAALIGRRVKAVQAIENEGGRLVGARYRVGPHDIRVEVIADDLFVDGS